MLPVRKSVYHSKRVDTKKVKTIVYIPQDLWEKISSMAPKIYGINRGALSYAVEEGLKYWLTYHSDFAKSNPRPSIREVYNGVMKWIFERNGYKPDRIKTSDLIKSVMCALNIKMRSAKDWIFKFYVEGLIKPYIPPKIELIKPSQIRSVRIWEIVAKEA